MIPPIGHPISVLIHVYSVYQGVSVAVDIEEVVTVVGAPLHHQSPVHLRNDATWIVEVVWIVPVVVEHEAVVCIEGVEPPSEVPVVVRDCNICIAVLGTIDGIAVSLGPAIAPEVVRVVYVHYTAVSVIRVEEIIDPIVVVIPVLVVLEAVSIHVGVYIVRSVVPEHRAV